ncbi:phosphorylase [Sphingomonas sp. RB3P16]|uniref:phosphorylase family protein n=1 Tax=Parasphingomonas frigoris TaxID=3096163 RepID=UPI002FC5F18B
MSLLVACGLTREAAIIKRAGFIPVVGGGNAAALENRLEDTITEYASEGWQFDAVLSCGVAGALDPTLRAGDVLVGDLHSASFPGEGRGPVGTSAVAGRSTSPQPPSLLDPGLRRGSALVEWLAQHLLDVHRGTVVGADSIIASAAAKAALYAETGAIAVDMESHVAARVAARHNLPFAILRTISDSADHALPPAALVGMNPDGSVALGAILKSLAREPQQLPALIRTGRDAGAAFRSLSRALGALEAVGIGRLDPRELGLDMR